MFVQKQQGSIRIVRQVQSCQSCFSRFNKWQWLQCNTTSQQLTACLCLEANTDLHCLEHSELFFMHVSVSNLHFPQMKLVSEKPPESVLEGVIFKIFQGEHAPRSPLYYGVQSMPFLIPYGNLARQVFLMFVQKQQRSI